MQIFSATIDPTKLRAQGFGVARDRKRIEELSAASPADILGRGRHAVALLAEDNALAWRGQLPEPGEVGVLPAFASVFPCIRTITDRRLIEQRPRRPTPCEWR